MWLTVKELASYIKVKEKTLYNFISHGAIPHYRIGKLIRFKQSEIDIWINSKKAVPLKKKVDDIIKSAYTPLKGRPGHLKREVKQC